MNFFNSNSYSGGVLATNSWPKSSDNPCYVRHTYQNDEEEKFASSFVNTSQLYPNLAGPGSWITLAPGH